MAVLTDLSQAFAAVVESAGRSVVRVDARRRFPSSGFVWSADGTLITAAHTVERDEDIRVGLGDGTEVDAALIGRDPSTDLAVLRVEAAGLTPLPRGDVAGVRVGHLALVLGRPGRTVQATMGIVTVGGPGTSWRTPEGAEVEPYLRADVGFFPGISGGALVDTEGRLLGMHTVGLHRRTGLAVPVPTIERVAAALAAHGRIRRGYLGVGPRPVSLPPDLEAAAGRRVGLLLLSVERNSPAERAGLLVGDILLQVNGRPTSSPRDLMAALGQAEIGSTATIRLLRGGQLREVQVTVGERI